MPQEPKEKALLITPAWRNREGEGEEAFLARRLALYLFPFLDIEIATLDRRGEGQRADGAFSLLSFPDTTTPDLRKYEVAEKAISEALIRAGLKEAEMPDWAVEEIEDLTEPTSEELIETVRKKRYQVIVLVSGRFARTFQKLRAVAPQARYVACPLSFGLTGRLKLNSLPAFKRLLASCVAVLCFTEAEERLLLSVTPRHQIIRLSPAFRADESAALKAPIHLPPGEYVAVICDHYEGREAALAGALADGLGVWVLITRPGRALVVGRQGVSHGPPLQVKSDFWRLAAHSRLVIDLSRTTAAGMAAAECLLLSRPVLVPESHPLTPLISRYAPELVFKDEADLVAKIKAEHAVPPDLKAALAQGPEQAVLLELVRRMGVKT